MVKIDIDHEVLEKLGEIAIPFKETSPNMVIRRLLGMSYDRNFNDNIHEKKINKKYQVISHTSEKNLNIDKINNSIDELRKLSSKTHPAFLTFLMDKHLNSKGNYKTSDIVGFMETVNLKLINSTFRNPWMKAPYGGDKNGLISCQRTIEHFKQTRKFGCWGGKDIKEKCDSTKECVYHPNNPEKMKNKCDLRNGVIWKRSLPGSSFEYGMYYLAVIKKQILNNSTIPLKQLLKIVFPNTNYNENLIEKFKKDFHFNDEELDVLFSI